jgi:hypothetical protein
MMNYALRVDERQVKWTDCSKWLSVILLRLGRVWLAFEHVEPAGYLLDNAPGSDVTSRRHPE